VQTTGSIRSGAGGGGAGTGEPDAAATRTEEKVKMLESVLAFYSKDAGESGSSAPPRETMSHRRSSRRIHSGKDAADAEGRMSRGSSGRDLTHHV